MSGPAPYVTYPPEPMPVEPVTLEGRHVRLEPMRPEHAADLAAACADPAMWTYMPLDGSTPAGMAAIVQAAVEASERGTELPFTTFERATGRVVGGSRYLNIDRLNHRLEIGYTFVAPPWQRSAVNSEAKLLMLGHAFDHLRANRVELKTDALNVQSRTAILALGATFEGTFRNHMITRHGRLRDSVYYSITVQEWPAVRAGLEARLARHAARAAEAPAPGQRTATTR
ncbi:MAG TPA: GNAT family protein [Candidatus Limnocylindrales bacterium]